VTSQKIFSSLSLSLSPSLSLSLSSTHLFNFIFLSLLPPLYSPLTASRPSSLSLSLSLSCIKCISFQYFLLSPSITVTNLTQVGTRTNIKWVQV
ncbi:hypothetical protein, partial [Candidatus Cardinium sp. cBcalN1]|uniref:hypothetical protein n=1 Tax=Candidatus Cardinium sp. cBcalN1 TaxID=2699437 RepID=UPI001FB50415